MDKIRVFLCTNDYRNGSHTGSVSAFRFGDQLSVWAYHDAMTCRLEGDTKLRLGRKTFPIVGHRSWVGSWCWDAVLVDINVANQIAEYVRKTGKFNVEEGYEKTWEAWENNIPIQLLPDNVEVRLRQSATE